MTDFAGVPDDLIALELERRGLETRAAAELGGRHILDECIREIAEHPWLVERRGDWRGARKTLKAAADRYLALWEGVVIEPDEDARAGQTPHDTRRDAA